MAVDLNEIPSYKNQMQAKIGGGKQPEIKRVNIDEMLKAQNTPEPVETDEALKIAEEAKKAAEAKKAQEDALAAEVAKKVKKSDTGLEGLDELGDGPILGEPKKTKDKDTNMGELRRLREEADTRATELQTRLDGIEAEHKKQIEELEGKLEQTAFEKSPKFKQKYQAPYDQAIETLTAFVKDFDEDPSVIQTAMTLKGKERIAFIDDKFGGGAAAAEMLRLVTAADLQNANLTKAITDYKSTKAEIAESEVSSERQDQQQMLKTFDKTVDALSKKLSYFREVDGDDEHNAEVIARVAHAKAIITGEASEEDIMLAPFLSVVCRAAIKRANALAVELQKYKSRLKDENELEPSIHRGTSDVQSRIQKGKPQNARSAIMAELRD